MAKTFRYRGVTYFIIREWEPGPNAKKAGIVKNVAARRGATGTRFYSSSRRSDGRYTRPIAT